MIDIRIGERIKYQGLAGTSRKHLAVKIAEVIDSGEDGEIEDDE